MRPLIALIFMACLMVPLTGCGQMEETTQTTIVIGMEAANAFEACGAVGLSPVPYKSARVVSNPLYATCLLAGVTETGDALFFCIGSANSDSNETVNAIYWRKNWYEESQKGKAERSQTRESVDQVDLSMFRFRLSEPRNEKDRTSSKDLEKLFD